jgi:hypothetical protein
VNRVTHASAPGANSLFATLKALLVMETAPPDLEILFCNVAVPPLRFVIDNRIPLLEIRNLGEKAQRAKFLAK